MSLSLAGGRAEGSGSAHGGQDASARLLSTLLTEMDGLESATGSLHVQLPCILSDLASVLVDRTGLGRTCSSADKACRQEHVGTTFH